MRTLYILCVSDINRPLFKIGEKEERSGTVLVFVFRYVGSERYDLHLLM